MTLEAEPVIMYQVECPHCGCQNIFFKEDIGTIECIECQWQFDVSLPAEETGELIFDVNE